MALGGDRHELRAHSPGFAFVADVGKRNRCAAEQADGAGAADGALTRDALRAADLEADPLAVRDRDDVALLALLLAEPE